MESGATATFYEGSTSALTPMNGGQLTVIGGLALYTTINGGEQSIKGKGIAFYTGVNGGTAVVHGTSNDPRISGGGKQQVAYTGTVNKAVLESGTQEVFGKAFATTMNSGI